MDWPQDYVWPQLTKANTKVGSRIWIDTDHTFFDAVITEVSDVDEDGSYTMTCQRYPHAPEYVS